MNDKATILAVDDSSESLALLVKLLSPEGYRVHPADSGELALAAVAANPPDLILLDVRMPGIDGLEVCRQLKSREETRHIPIILISAFADATEWVAGLQLGASDYITKPFQPEELLTRVRIHLALGRANASLEMQAATLRQANEQLQFEIVKRQRIEEDLRANVDRADRSRRALLGVAEDQRAATQALRAREEQLRFVADHAPVFIAHCDPETRYKFVNRPYAGLFGLRPADMIGKQAREVLGEEAYAEASPHMEAALAGQSIEFDVVLPATPGGPRAGHASYAPERDASARVVGFIAAIIDITERKKADEARGQLAAIVENSNDAILSRTLDGTIVSWNAGAERMFGYTATEAIGKPATFNLPPGRQPHAARNTERLLRGETIAPRESQRVTKDGRVIDVLSSISPLRDSAGKIIGVSVILHDITERKNQEQRIVRLSRIHAILSGINSLIVRVRDRQELFAEACRIVVEHGGFGMAWINEFDAVTLDITPVAWAGIGAAEFTNAKFTARADAPLGQGVAGRAVREKTAVFCNDIAAEPDVGSPNRRLAIRQGYRSLIALPLFTQGVVMGTLTLYAKEPNFFSADELELLNGLARDVSFALDNFEQEAQHKRAEDALRESEERFRGLVEQSIAGLYIIQDGKFVYVNPRFVEIRGFGSTDELIGRDSLSLIAEKDRGTVVENNRRLLAGEMRSIGYNFTALCKDGSTTEVGVHGSRATYRGRPAIIGLMQDISEKKRAEEQIQRYVAQLETAFMSTVQVATGLSEMRDPYTAGHARRVGEIAVAISAELGFDARRQEGLRVAGYLHDIGKITIPTEILAKPGRLTPMEFDLIREHAQVSYNILKDVEFPWPVAEVALQHHERTDGSGYPQGLAGDAILIEARVMAVADVVEAMSSDRPYRPGHGIKTALAEIERGRGTAYDANAADACLKLFREKAYAIPA